LPWQKVGVTWVNDASLAEHLTDDNLHMLIVNVQPVRAIDALDFPQQVILDGSNAPQIQEGVGVDGAFCQGVSCFHLAAHFHLEIGVEGNDIAFADDDLFHPCRFESLYHHFAEGRVFGNEDCPVDLDLLSKGFIQMSLPIAFGNERVNIHPPDAMLGDADNYPVVFGDDGLTEGFTGIKEFFHPQKPAPTRDMQARPPFHPLLFLLFFRPS